MSDTGSDSDDGGISRTRYLSANDAEEGDDDMEEVPTNGYREPALVSKDGHERPASGTLPSLSLSILGVEPIDEFIKEIADFIHHMITTRPDHPRGVIEVEARVGILRDKHSGQRVGLPVLVETSTHSY
jgi:hypothetical protein